MRRFVPDRSDYDAGNLLIDIVERAVLANPQLPHWRDMLPRRDQSEQFLAVTCLAIRFVAQLYFDLVEDLGSLPRAKQFQIASNAFRVDDRVHDSGKPNSDTLRLGLA